MLSLYLKPIKYNKWIQETKVSASSLECWCFSHLTSHWASSPSIGALWKGKMWNLTQDSWNPNAHLHQSLCSCNYTLEVGVALYHSNLLRVQTWCRSHNPKSGPNLLIRIRVGTWYRCVHHHHTPSCPNFLIRNSGIDWAVSSLKHQESLLYGHDEEWITVLKNVTSLYLRWISDSPGS